MSEIEGWDDMGCYLEREYYYPSPNTEPDTRDSFDLDGNYHFNVNGASMGTPYTPNFPYRIAQEINEYVTREASLEDHHISREERHEHAERYLDFLRTQNAFADETIALNALRIWQLQHGRDLRGEEIL